jgi:hypothetical protein
MSTVALSPVSGLDTVLSDATAWQKRDAEMTRRIADLRRRRRKQQKLEKCARDCLFAAERAARLFLRDGNDASSRAACAEALVKAGQAMSRTRGPSTLETFLAPKTLPPADTPLGAHLLPLRFLVELLRLGQRGEQAATDAQLQRLPETPALSRFVDWFEITADLLCGVGEQEPGIRFPASVPLPDHECSLAVRDALLHILYGFDYRSPAGAKVRSGGQAAAKREEEPPVAGPSRACQSAVGVDTSSMPEPECVVPVVIEDQSGTEPDSSDVEKATGADEAIAPAAAAASVVLLEPAAYLMSWREILKAVKVRNTPEKRRRVRMLNERYDGPIIMPAQGGQPKVEGGKLLIWWNSLQQAFLDSSQKQLDRQATTANQYEYGRNLTVVPDLAGSVKKRRTRRPSQSS